MSSRSVIRDRVTIKHAPVAGQYRARRASVANVWRVSILTRAHLALRSIFTVTSPEPSVCQSDQSEDSSRSTRRSQPAVAKRHAYCGDSPRSSGPAMRFFKTFDGHIACEIRPQREASDWWTQAFNRWINGPTQTDYRFYGSIARNLRGTTFVGFRCTCRTASRSGTCG